MDLVLSHFEGTRRYTTLRAMCPVVLASLLAVALWFGRAYYSGSGTFSFLIWNLILAWIPYLGALWADHAHQRFPRAWFLLLVPGALWLAFLPNAPYLVTDFWHLAERPPVPLWYDIGVLATFSLTGLLLAAFSLRIMHRLVRYHLGSLVGWLFVCFAVGLSGLGVYLGRFLRWNSWDLLLNPRAVLADVVIRLAHPMDHLQTVGFTLLFAAILFVFYLGFTVRDST
jgi:uncharacterized membrane protein